MIFRRPRSLWRLALLALAVAALLPASALAASTQFPTAQDQGNGLGGPFGGSIELQPGAINGQVTLQPGTTVAVQGALADPGVDGTLQVTIPGQFVGTANASNGELSYNLALCGAGVAVALSGTSGTNVHFGFQDTASNPAACTAAPATSAQQALVMSPLLSAQAQPSGSTIDVQGFLLNWLRRLIGWSIVAFLLVLLVPAVPKALDVATETPPWGRIGIGVAVALILPFVGILLFAVGLPVGLWWLGVILLALYPVLLILSLSVSGLSLGSWLSRRASRPGVPMLALFGVGMVVLTFLSLLPYVGPIANIVAVAFGLGTLVLAPRSRTPAAVDPTSGLQPPAPEAPTGTVTSEPVAA